MTGTFGGLSLATSSLYAQQRGLDVTGQNIANVNTPGYSRQRAELQSIGGSAVSAVWATQSVVGGGVTAEDVTRIRDLFLENRAQAEGAASARLTAQSTGLDEVEAAFREPGDSGIQSLMSKVWAAYGDVSKSPNDIAARNNLLATMQTLVGGIQTTRATLDRTWTQTHSNLQTLVSEANTTAQGIADLNKAIASATAAGYPANELADTRDLMVQQLAQSIGATSSRGENGMVNVTVGGNTLIAGTQALTLTVAGPNNPGAVTPSSTADLTAVPAVALNSPRILVQPGATPVAVDGTAGGMLRTLAPNSPQGTSVVSYRAQLDDFAAALATMINTQNAAGYDRTGAAGGPLLAPSSGTTITAATISLAVTDPARIAAAKYGPDAAGPSTEGGNADAVFKKSLQPSGPDGTYRSLIVNLGVQSAVATRNVDIQTVIAGQVDSARESVSGVNLDEELTNMLQYQHAYAAAGRLISAIDETLDVLINRTGIVGR